MFLKAKILLHIIYKMSNKELEQILHRFFEHQILLKMFHFQTKSYGGHKAADVYMATFLINFDKFMEVAQGLVGRITLKNIDLKLKTLDDNTITRELTYFSDFLLTLPIKSRSELGNIRDDMAGQAEQLIYLLTFK